MTGCCGFILTLLAACLDDEFEGVTVPSPEGCGDFAAGMANSDMPDFLADTADSELHRPTAAFVVTAQAALTTSSAPPSKRDIKAKRQSVKGRVMADHVPATAQPLPTAMGPREPPFAELREEAAEQRRESRKLFPLLADSASAQPALDHSPSLTPSPSCVAIPSLSMVPAGSVPQATLLPPPPSPSSSPTMGVNAASLFSTTIASDASEECVGISSGTSPPTASSDLGHVPHV